ncbi:MAG: caspase family protein [Planctomycetaceae bacterium]|nr:caspase family protein [Planctomycetaceae bacterium]
MSVARGLLPLIVGYFALTSFAVAQPSAERDLVRTRIDGDDRPWLTLNTGGHAANVQSVAFSPDGKRLYSAGLDKVVNVWNITSALRDLRRTYLLERTVRWQQGRSLRGAIYALAVAPDDGLLAIGGYGASPGLGEIQLVDPVQNRLVKSLVGHRQAVASLAFSRDGAWLASVDLAGRALLWKRGDWSSTVLAESDHDVHGAAQADVIERHPRLRPVAIVEQNGAHFVLLGVFAGLDPAGRPQWKLRKQSVTDPTQVTTYDTLHGNPLSVIAVTNDGRRWATADGAGNIYLWTTGQPPTVESLAAGRPALSLAFTPDGKSLLAGLMADSGGASELQRWDVTTKQITDRKPLGNHAFACAISRDGLHYATTGGARHEVFVGRLAQFPAAISLHGQSQRLTRVAFHKTDGYRLGFGTSVAESVFNRYGPLARSFDPVAGELAGERVTSDDDYLPIMNPLGDWEVRRRDDGRLQLYRAGQPAGIMSPNPRFDGSARCWCWITNDAGTPLAVAVGTDVQNSIYVFGLIAEGECPVWRHYRGHQDLVTSLGVSRDGKYLASASGDGTLRLWSLAEIAAGATSVSRWGAEWSLEAGKLRVSRVHPAGPLQFNGVRVGDTIARVEWSDEGQTLQKLDEPAAMRDRLAAAPFGTQLDLVIERGEVNLPQFPRLPAWQPLATLFVSTQDEWSFWTPEGFYDASANGHTLFGWQVNRGLNRTPDFFRADQFRQRLERPDVLERLLEAGSVGEAFKLAELGPPPPGDEALRQQIAAAPRIEILAPVAESTVLDRVARVRARIEIPETAKLTETRMFAGGIAGQSPRIVEERTLDGARSVTYEWTASLPTEPRNLIQVLAQTADQAVGAGSVIVEQPPLQPTRPPKLYLLALGMNEYRDAEVQPLKYAVADVNAMLQTLKSRAAKLFQVAEPTLLVNEQVTPGRWRETFGQLRERLRDASPDDLLVIFLAGHGFVDHRSGRYFFAGYDITRDEFNRADYSSSISWSDLQLLADVPCRKLALLDTCHSGAIQPLRGRNLKTAVRALQSDQILTLTASAGHERSEENVRWGHGAFTKTLLDGLDGQADASQDGLVSLGELIEHVQRGVPVLTEGRQNPTAGPSDLLPYVTLKLSEVK